MIRPIAKRHPHSKVEGFAVEIDGNELSAWCETYDVALIIGLCYKYLGPNDGRVAVKLLCRMFRIETEWLS